MAYNSSAYAEPEVPAYNFEDAEQPLSGWYEVQCVQCGSDQAHDSITSVACDPVHELIWAGTTSGLLHAHHADSMDRHCTALAGEVVDDSLPASVSEVVLSNELVVTGVSSGVRAFSRGGVCVLSLRANALRDTRSVSFNPFEASQVAAGGASRVLAIADLATGRLIRQCSLRGHTSSSVTNSAWTVDYSPLVIFTTTTGRISLCDASSLREVSATAAYVGPVTSLSVQGFTLATTGFSSVRNGLSYLDPFIKLYDIRTMKELPSVSFASCNAGCSPGSCQCIPSPAWRTCFDSWTEATVTNSPALWGLSMDGILQCFDIGTPEGLAANPNAITPVSSQIRLDAEYDSCTSLSISPAGLIIIGDSGGFIHEWTASATPRINYSSEALSLPRPATTPSSSLNRRYAQLALTAEDGYPVPLQPEQAGSAFNNIMLSDAGDLGRAEKSIKYGPYMPGRIPTSFLEKAKLHDGVAHVTAPPSFIRNCLLNTQYISFDPVGKAFRNGFYTDDVKGTSDATKLKSSNTLPLAASEATVQKMKGRSRYVEMDLVAYESAEGFDFLRWNKSGKLGFCGLENGLPNTYINPLIQVLYFCPPFRRSISSHTCERNSCMSCELNFLFHMLAKGEAGSAVETGNFTRTFMSTANAAALGLLEGFSQDDKVRSRLEACARFLLEDLGKEVEAGIFGAEVSSRGRFEASGHEWQRTSCLYVHSSNYETAEASYPNSHNFERLMERSLRTELESTKAYSEASKKFETMSQRRQLVSLPNILLIGCNANARGYEEFWSSKDGDCLPAAIHVGIPGVNSDAMSVRVIPTSTLGFDVTRPEKDGRDEETDLPTSGATAAVRDSGETEASYDLGFVIAHIIPEKSDVPYKNRYGHLVAYIRVPAEYKTKDPAAKEWWCFNDFVISPCTDFNEVSLFHSDWKMPCLLGFVRRDINIRIPTIPPAVPLDPREVLSPSLNRGIGLQADEDLPGPGTVIAIDCEFVCTGREEAEIQGDGTRTVIAPTRFALARVSVIRGNGPRKGDILIDDYVFVRERVVDYLTRYSGLREGDLDPSRSSFSVVSLKSVYIKLRCLVDSGCLFVGHGLKKDFRIINFVVPSAQIVDTVTIYRISDRRLLSLRYLVGTLFGDEIQETIHDSVEDSKAALSLYELYVKLLSQEKLADVVRALYKYGYANGWKYDPSIPFVMP